ncbi:AraC family transcriptional regulator [Ancylobacter sp. MQZ15Z-1]|uniref:AraC family transcriptional regulator n=1 Tax=Ancylobacter mangrovi TaxID=2972472 RepID=A0A9X2PDJ1_9HYPH|nr:AraC family transcriptional regulator [Ancylobacter mangrovi]MCS0495940.1 AraC family transcriptional regulator [Ancylobacter mangrovi]
MSLHVSPPFEGLAVTPRIVEIQPAAAHGRAPRSGPDAWDGANESLSVRLDHVGMSVAVSPQNGRTPEGPDADVVRLAMPRSEYERVVGMLSGRDGDLSGRGDPVIDRLTLALGAAQGNGSEYSGLYADALRLAILTRLLGLPGGETRTADLEAPADAPVQPKETRRPKSGLPKWRFKRVAAYVAENLAESVTLADMATAAGLSRMHFAAQFRVSTGMRPHDYLLRQRIEAAQQMMLETGDSLIQIALGVGFQTQAHFTTVFRKIVGETPYQWRSANRMRG